MSANFNNAINANIPGFQSLSTTGGWEGRTFIAGSGVGITNPDGIAGNPEFTFTGSGEIAGSLQVNHQVFTTSGTYTPSTGLVYALVEIVGGGGGGGGCTDTTGVTASIGQSGSGGEYANGIFSSSELGGPVSVIIGAGGAGGAAASNGTVGGNTSFGSFMNAIGGNFGLGSAEDTNFSSAAGVDGGSGGAGGDIHVAGGASGAGFGATITGLGGQAISGNGGSSFFGGGAAGTNNVAGNNGQLYGSGGSGGAAKDGQVGQIGGNGADGFIIVTEFIQSGAATLLNYTNVAFGDSPYTVLATDQYISVDTTGGAVILNFPNSPTTNQYWYVKDRLGNSQTNSITLTTLGGTVTFDASTSYIINQNYEAINLLANATPNYEIY